LVVFILYHFVKETPYATVKDRLYRSATALLFILRREEQRLSVHYFTCSYRQPTTCS